MICPKGKISKARRDKRRAHTWRISTPGLILCSNCREFTVKNKVCRSCGIYKGRDVLKLSE